MDFKHVSVLLDETIEALDPKPDGSYIDGTAGGGGHSAKILERLSGRGRLLMIDRDPDAIAVLQSRFSSDERAKIAAGNFSQMQSIAEENGIERADGILLDLGVSSHQLDDAERGFSYHNDAPLDMRMSREGVSAKDLVNSLPETELVSILETYGEEKCAGMIARAIVKRRALQPIETTLELAEIIKAAVPQKVRKAEKHPARKTFQALRIAVNGELEALSEGLDEAFELLKPGGRICVITFHSLEDRIVKQRMNDWCRGCICPPDFPVCVCGRKPRAKLIYKKGVAPGEEELRENLRSRSARLRVCEKMEEE